MKRNRRFCLVLIILILIVLELVAYSVAFAIADARISLKVIDEEGEPVENAKVEMGFRIYLHWDSKSNRVEGTTDSQGNFSVSEASDNYVGFRVNKDGYYQSTGEFKYKETKNGKWEPWNPQVTVVMRKKENPVPMYARDTQLPLPLIIPTVGKEIGFDLIEYDWVSPYGKGHLPDFIFKIDRNYIDDRNFDVTLTITFTNKFDGIQQCREDRRYGSYFKLPRLAPENGYMTKLTANKSMKPDKGVKGTKDENMNYFFRVRSEEKEGKLIRAMYGKIHGDFRIDPRGNNTSVILFTYYLNPDYTRNMEFGSNLFKGLNVGID